MKVYSAIAAVQGELAKHGIGKDSKNTFDNYKFRGIDAVYNALSPLLAKHGLCIMPRIIERNCEERVSKKGDPMFYVTVTAEFDFVASEDGSKHTVRTYGEAMDRSDKATNKAMSAAYKYAAFMTFAIPTEGDNDADESTPEVQARQEGQSQVGAVSPPADPFPAGPAKNITQLRALQSEAWKNIEGCGDSDELEAYLATAELKAVAKQLAKLTGKHAELWSGDNRDNPGLLGLIQRRRDEFNLERAA